MVEPETLTIDVELTDLAHGGDAVGHHDGRAIFVPGGLPGERIRVRLVRERGAYARATLVDVLRPSPDRVVPRYPELSDSGGFQWQHLTYPAQLTWKTRIVRQLMLRIGHFPEPAVRPTIGMPASADPWRYRTVAQFAIGVDGAIGFRRAGSHDVLDMPECPIVHPALDQVYQAVRSWIRARWGEDAARYVERFTVRVSARAADDVAPRLLPPGIPALPHPPDLRASARDVARAVDVDEADMPDGNTPAPGQHDTVLSLEVRPGGALEADGGPEAVAEALLGAVESLVGVVVLGAPGGHVAVGRDYVYDRVFDRVFRISAGSFFQVNPAQTSVLVRHVLAAAHTRPTDRVLDGYSGVGLFSLFLAGRAAHVQAIESQTSAVADARASARINHISNVTTTEDVVERALGHFARQRERVDVVLVDPPRAGCHPRALEAMKRLDPRTIVYVSCDPSTLARDLRILCEDRYQVAYIQPVDLFPHTAHIESIALCERTRA